MWQLRGGGRTSSEQSLALPLTAEKCCGHSVLCPRTPGVMAARPSVLWKSCLRKVSQTRRGRGRSSVCLWMKLKMESACGAGAEPSLPFPNGEDWSFPPAPKAKQLSKQLAPPSTRCMLSFILSRLERIFSCQHHRGTAFQKLFGPQEKRKKTGWRGGKRPTVSLDLWASHANLKNQKQNIGIPRREFLQELSATNSTFHLNLKVYKFPEVIDVLQFTVTKVITNREDSEDTFCFHL